MADTDQKPEKVGNTGAAQSADESSEGMAPPEEVFSDAELDQAIAEEDPEFMQSMKALAKDKELSISEIHFSSALEAINEEKARWSEGSKVAKLIFRFFPPIIYFSLALRKIWQRILALAVSTGIRLRNLGETLVHVSKRIFYLAISLFKSLKEKILAIVHIFQGFSKFRKVGTVFSFMLLFLTGAYFYQTATKGVIPKKFDLFALNLEKVASSVQFYEPENDFEPFYENLRIAIHTVLLPKFYVNLRPSKASGPNPMGAFEFFVEGMSPEVVIEAKDREVEVRDRISRTLEGFTFDIAEDPDGKKRICEKIKNELNSILTTGKIKEVYIKNLVIKP